MNERVLIDDQAGRDIDLWAEELLHRERTNAPTANTVGGGITLLGAIEILEELRAFLRGETE